MISSVLHRWWAVAILLLAVFGGGLYVGQQEAPSVADSIVLNQGEPTPVTLITQVPESVAVEPSVALAVKPREDKAVTPLEDKEASTTAPIRVLVVPQMESTLVSQINSQVVGLNVSLGSAFKQGDVLVKFDCKEQYARKAIAEAELDAAKQTYHAKLRMQALSQVSELEVNLTATEVNKAQAQLRLVETQLDHCQIVAPFSGRVAKLNISQWNGVSVGDPLLEIVTNNQLKLRLNVPATWANHMRSGTPLEVELDELGVKVPAQVIAVNSRVDAVSFSIELEAKLTKPVESLLPGMSGHAFFSPQITGQ